MSQLPAAQPSYQCPICQTKMDKIDQRLQCQNNHQFDYAKEGYVNLLPVQFKKSLSPGDDKAMVLARRQFLQLGHYQFLRDELLSVIGQYQVNNMVDLGCGEGYYTSFMQTAMTNSQVYGVDISKDAIRYSAKRNKQVHYCVATNSKTPFSDQQFELILNVFAPLVGKECKRILSDQGVIISATPGAMHLHELKRAIYDNVEQHQQALPPEGFKVRSRHNIEQEISLQSSQEINDLLTMTPFGWKIVPEKKQKLLAKQSFTLTLSFDINVFEPIVTP